MMYEHSQLPFERPSERFNLENRSSYTSSKYIADQKADRYPNEGMTSAPVAPPRTHVLHLHIMNSVEMGGFSHLGSSYHELGDMRGHQDSARIIGNEPALYAESRTGRVRPSTS